MCTQEILVIQIICHNTSALYNEGQDGTVERTNLSLTKKTVCMIKSAILATPYRSEAAQTVAYMNNMTTIRVLRGTVTVENLEEINSYYSHLKKLKCLSYVISKNRGRKYKCYCKTCIFFGYTKAT